MRIYSDPGVSGAVALSERPAGAALLADLRAGDVVIAAKMDRMFRSARDALATVEEMRQRSVKLVLTDMGVEPVTENGASRLFFTILAAMAEFERNRIAERIADGRRGKARKGGYVGGMAPYGWRVEGSGRDAVLVEEPGEQAAIRLVLERHAAGHSYRGIAAWMNAAGHQTRHGGGWNATQVRRVVLAAEEGETDE